MASYGVDRLGGKDISSVVDCFSLAIGSQNPAYSEFDFTCWACGSQDWQTLPLFERELILP